MAKPKNIVGPQVRRFRDQHDWSQSVLAAKCQLARVGMFPEGYAYRRH